MGAMTWETLAQRINSGRGSGHRDAYQPWIWIRRKNPSGRGNQVVDAMPGYRRGSHFLARVEWHFALLSMFLGAHDVREQYPMWPMAHPHPLADLPFAIGQSPYRSRLRGLLSIAEDAGIAHGVEIGSKGVPYVATIDLMITLLADSGVRMAAISLKPHEEIIKAESTDRIVERLELEERYMLEAKAHYTVLDQSLLGDFTGENLEAFSSAWRLPPHLRFPSLVGDFCGRFIDVATHTSVEEGIRRAGSDLRLSSTIDATLLWRHGVWTRRISIDVTQRLEMGAALRLGGSDIAARLAVELFGEVAA